MPRTITLRFPGDPVPAPRPRFHQGGTHMPEAYTDYKKALAWAFKERVKTPLIGPLAIKLGFHRKNRLRVDLDNLEKTVLDAGNGVAWLDDSQIVEMHSKKVLGSHEPRVEVELTEVEG